MSAPEPQPQTAIAATGKVASEVVGGLQSQPMMLGIVVLNVIGIAAALFFLNKLSTESHERFSQLLSYCLSDERRAAADLPPTVLLGETERAPAQPR